MVRHHDVNTFSSSLVYVMDVFFTNMLKYNDGYFMYGVPPPGRDSTGYYQMVERLRYIDSF